MISAVKRLDKQAWKAYWVHYEGDITTAIGM